MKKSRIIVLFLAIAAAAGAFVLANGDKAPPPEPVAAASPPPPIPTVDVLVASRDLPLGHKIADGDLAWKTWLKDNLPAGAVQRDAAPKALEDDKGAFVRSDFYTGDAIRAEKLIKADSGYVSILLASGRRAVAINVDSQGATSAGNFILPGDHVDVVKIFHPETKPGAPPTGGQDVFQTERLLTNVKVLAIGPNLQNKDGLPVAAGSNATLELTPDEADTVILGQRTGQLSLVLRSTLDSAGATEGVVRQAGHGLSVVRYGNISEDTGR